MKGKYKINFCMYNKCIIKINNNLKFTKSEKIILKLKCKVSIMFFGFPIF